jgi:hypothetical protein
MIKKKIQHPDGVREMEVIEYCVWKKEKEEKKQVGETESELEKKGTTHNTQKNEDFLLENDPGGWTQKQEIFYQQHSRGTNADFISLYRLTDTIFTFVKL